MDCWSQWTRLWSLCTPYRDVRLLRVLSKIQRLAFYSNWYGPPGLVVMQLILFKNIKVRWTTRKRPHFGQAVVDGFVRRTMNLLKRRESGNTHVHMNSWNKTMKTVDSCGLEREVREAVGMINPRGLYSLGGTMVQGLLHSSDEWRKRKVHQGLLRHFHYKKYVYQFVSLGYSQCICEF